jgi:hypothetical protein
MSIGIAPSLMYDLVAVRIEDRLREARDRSDRVAARRGYRTAPKH